MKFWTESRVSVQPEMSGRPGGHGSMTSGHSGPRRCAMTIKSSLCGWLAAVMIHARPLAAFAVVLAEFGEPGGAFMLKILMVVLPTRQVSRSAVVTRRKLVSGCAALRRQRPGEVVTDCRCSITLPSGRRASATGW